MLASLNPWVLLSGAIILEVISTVLLKTSEGFSKLLPGIISLILYSLSFLFMAKAIVSIHVGVAYAIWSAVGIIGIAVISIFLFEEQVSKMQALSYFIIIVGIISLNLSSPSTH